MCAIVFLHFLKGLSQEIDHLSLVGFFLHSRTFQQDLGFGVNCFQLKESWGLEKGFKKENCFTGGSIFQNNELLYLGECKRFLLF